MDVAKLKFLTESKLYEMIVMERVGIGFTGAPSPVEEMVEYVRLAEKSGFESAWMAEDYFLRDAVSPLACFALATKKIKVAVGVINPYSRNSAVIAETIATIDELSGGRAILTLGTGVPPLIEQMGIKYERPLAIMRESVHAVRELLAGEEVTFQGRAINLKNVTLGVNPYFFLLEHFKPIRSRIPIYVAAIGPKMLQLAGEIGDGVLLTAGCSPQYVKYAVENIKIGAKKADRDPNEIDVATYVLYSVSKTGRVNNKAMKGFLAYALSYSDPKYLKMSGFDETDVKLIRETLETKGMAEASKLLTDAMVNTYTATGTRERCREKLEEYKVAGITLPIIFTMGINTKLAIKTIEEYITQAEKA